MENQKSLCSKKILLDGSIVKNNDFGIGYAITWQTDLDSDDVKSGATIQDVLSLVINEIEFINKTKYSNQKYENAKQKIIQALNIINQ